MTLYLCVMLSLPSGSAAQPLAKGKSKFLGSSLSSARTDFATYWNQVTPENAGKWGSAEPSQGNYNWTPLDDIYNFAISNSLPYKHHNLVWGNQQPSWIGSLDSAGQRAAVDHWIDTVAQRYGSTTLVDVVNEPFHAPPSYMNALGGTGKTGWDWVITVFQMARNHFFHGVKLLLNEYNVLQDNGVTTNYIALIDTLNARKLIDGIGIQGHYFEFKSPAGAASPYTYPIGTLKSNLDRLAATGLPVYISEFDINEAADSTQLQNYQTYFPLFWENPGVKGITLWGYVQGLTWQTNAYLVRSNGSERPALKWIRRYMATPQAPLAVSPVGTTGVPRNPRLVWRTAPLASSYRLQVSGTGTFSSTVVDSTIADTTLLLSPLSANTTYYWHVSAANDSGMSSYSAAASFATGDQIVSVGTPRGIPEYMSVSQNYPNPFNPSTVIEYRLPDAGRVLLRVYDVLGRDIATLVDGRQSAGSYRVTFDAGRLPAGVYFYRLQAAGRELVGKMMLLK
jgi:endo-1,4-beta-xylanase